MSKDIRKQERVMIQGVKILRATSFLKAIFLLIGGVLYVEPAGLVVRTVGARGDLAPELTTRHPRLIINAVLFTYMHY